MQSALADFVGIHPDVFHWVIVPILIFLARICDVSIGTLRMMFLMSGRRQTATLLGFFESLIWLIAISQILQNVTHPISYIAYAAGFATGIFVGMMIEERLAVGKIIVRIITQRDASILADAIREAGMGITKVHAEGSRGPVNLLFTVTNRHKLPVLTQMIQAHNPNAFYSVESVRFAKDEGPGNLQEGATRLSALWGLFHRIRQRK